MDVAFWADGLRRLDPDCDNYHSNGHTHVYPLELEHGPC